MPAPKGHRYLYGNKGLSKRYSTVEQLQADIDAYFKKCDERIVIEYDNQNNEIKRKKPEPYTIEGLCIALGFNTRESLLNYEKEPGYEMFFDTVREAKVKIQQNKVLGALDGRYPQHFAMFDLKNNHRYKDKTEVEQTNVNIDADNKSISEIKSIIGDLLGDD